MAGVVFSSWNTRIKERKESRITVEAKIGQGLSFIGETWVTLGKLLTEQLFIFCSAQNKNNPLLSHLERK